MTSASEFQEQNDQQNINKIRSSTSLRALLTLLASAAFPTPLVPRPLAMIQVRFLFFTNTSRQVVSPSTTSKTFEIAVTSYQLHSPPAVIQWPLGHSASLKDVSGCHSVQQFHWGIPFLVISIYSMQSDDPSDTLPSQFLQPSTSINLVLPCTLATRSSHHRHLITTKYTPSIIPTVSTPLSFQLTLPSFPTPHPSLSRIFGLCFGLYPSVVYSLHIR